MKFFVILFEWLFSLVFYCVKMVFEEYILKKKIINVVIVKIIVSLDEGGEIMQLSDFENMKGSCVKGDGLESNLMDVIVILSEEENNCCEYFVKLSFWVLQVCSEMESYSIKDFKFDV